MRAGGGNSRGFINVLDPVDNMRRMIEADRRGDVKAWSRCCRAHLHLMEHRVKCVEVSEQFYDQLADEVTERIRADEDMGGDLIPYLPEHPLTFQRIPIRPVRDELLPIALEMIGTHPC